jgi:succinoglycan biosynthesis protein ExoM
LNRNAHISVCICTYKRPELLQKLLKELQHQQTNGLFTYSIVVADNDAKESARVVVDACARSSGLEIKYCIETEQNIALARNRVIENAKGNWLAFIDDDEFPVKDWLLKLFQACHRYEVSGALGPVLPFFEQEPPRWIIKGKFYDRPRHETGFIIDPNEGRTGNVLLRREVLHGVEGPFRAQFGSGGEDRDLFKRLIAAGQRFVWCDEAAAYETVPQVRWTRSFMLRRALLRGKASLANPAGVALQLFKSLVAIPAYAVALPFLLPVGQHAFMRYLIRLCDHLGRVLAFMKINPVKEKYVIE